MRPLSLGIALGLALGMIAASARAEPPSAQVVAHTLSPDMIAKAVAARPNALPVGAVTLAPSATLTTRAQDLVQMPLALEGVGHDSVLAKFRVTSGSGKISARPGGATVLQLPSEGSTIISSTPGHDSAEHEEIGVNKKTRLPWLLIETKKTTEGSSARSARPFLTLARAIEWNAALKRHVAEFLFGLDPETGDPGRLGHPIDARFTVTCNSVTPEEAHVTQVGPSGYGTVTVECSPEVKNESPEQFLEVHVDQGNLRYPFKIPHRPGPLSLLSSSTRVLGFGFGTTVLTVAQTEEDGSPLLTDSDMPVQLLVAGGSLDISAVTLPRGRHLASSEVHPPGVGRLELTAVSGPLRSPTVTVELAWPVVPVLAMIGGGALGGFLSAFRGRARKRRGARAFEGALVGLLITTVVLVLPSFAMLPSWARDTELGLFVLAATAGFVGTPLIGHATRALFPALAQSKEA